MKVFPIPPENLWITRDRYSRMSTETLYLHILDSVKTTEEVIFIMDLYTSDCKTMELPFTRPTVTVKSKMAWKLHVTKRKYGAYLKYYCPA